MLILNDSRCSSGQSWDTVRRQCVPNGTTAAKSDGNGGWYIPGTSTSGTGTSSGSGTTSGSGSTTTSTPSTAQLNTILGSTQLSADERAAITAVFNSIATGDTQAAQQMLAKLQLAASFADPMLARQIKLITAELEQTVQGMDNDLAYNETKIQNQIADLREDVTFNKGQLSIMEQAELKKLDDYFGEKLIQTRDSMAALGMTESRKRTRAEEILAEQKGDLVESTNREFATQQRTLDESLQRGERDTQAELERLRQLNEQNTGALALKAEELLGSSRLGGISSLDGLPTIGGIEGNVDLDYRDQIANFAF